MKTTNLLIAILLISFAMCLTAKADVVLNSDNFPDANFRAYLVTLTSVSEGGTIPSTKIKGIIKMRCSAKNIADLTGIQYFTALQELSCGSNTFTKIDLSKNTALTYLDCDGCKLTSLDLSNNVSLQLLYCYESSSLTSVNVSQCKQLQDLQCYKCALTAIDVTNNVNLLRLNCDYNKLVVLDVSKNTKLTDLDCSANKIKVLDVSSNTKLINLAFSRNQIKSINLQKNTALLTLGTASNPLTVLDLSKNIELNSLNCSYDKLAALDLSKNTKLTVLLQHNNQRRIKVYSYDRHNDGTIDGYYVPLVAQTTGTHPTSNIATLIDNVGQVGDQPFDLSRVVPNSWEGATIATLNGVTVLLLDASKETLCYQYKTDFSGSSISNDNWDVNESTVAPVVCPNAYFTLYWDTYNGDVATGVDDVENNDINVFTTTGTINISGSFNGKVNVYNMCGQQVYSGTDSRIEVPQGMYVVKFGQTVKKVLVR
jgi:hypothetical protein